MLSEYTVRDYPHGTAVFGVIPLSVLATIGGAREGGICDFNVAKLLGAALAICHSAEDAEAWRRELEGKGHG